ncbi:MAG TPA: hypothetical protein VF640_05190, partial [Acidimicrobiales bacterium]
MQGGALGDEVVEVAAGTLVADSSFTVTFEAKVADPLPAGVTSLAAQGRITSAELQPILTDDPHTNEEADVTVVALRVPGGGSGGGGGNGLPAPTVGGLEPPAGTILSAPTPVAATLTPPAGATVVSWTVGVRRTGTDDVRELASGTGPDVAATVDPTVLANGGWELVVESASSNGGISVTVSPFVVDGQLKLGRYTTTFEDMAVAIAGLPLRVLRTYDSFDTAVGDFGAGWTLSVASFRVATNGPLGQGGWSMRQCGGGLIFVPLCFSSDRPHYVGVTWPDGRNEVFDLTPARGSTFLAGLTQAEFTGRPGTTSTLEAADGSLWFSGDGNLYGGFFGTDGLYDPTRFVLTDRFGTEYLLDMGDGLLRVLDRAGTTTTFTDAGIVSSAGPSVRFIRDAQGRITTVEGPDGSTVGYTYDAAGDLVRVVDQNGDPATFGYAPGHLLTSIDAGGRPYRTLEYDDDGRLAAVVDGEGNRTAVAVDVDGRQEVVTDAESRLTTITTFDDRGNPVRQEQAHDGVVDTTTWTWDDEDRVTSRTDPAGHTSRGTYDGSGNLTSVSDAEGRTTRITYSAFGEILTWTDPAGNVTRYRWNDDGTLATITDADGHAET